MKSVTILNPISIKYLWDNPKYQELISNILNYTLNIKEEWTLLDYFNYKNNNARSYTIFESNNNIVILDYNFNKSNILLKIDINLLNYLKETTNKEVSLIILNNYNGEDNSYNNLYDIYKNTLDNNYQILFNPTKDLSKYLNKIPKELYKIYLHENELKFAI